MADVKQQLLELREKLEDLTDDPKATIEEFVKHVKNIPGLSSEAKANLLKTLLKPSIPEEPEGVPNQLPLGAPIQNPWLEFVTLFGLISLVILLLVFIGYRLYTNITEKERRKEMKRLQKEQKKKK